VNCLFQLLQLAAFTDDDDDDASNTAYLAAASAPPEPSSTCDRIVTIGLSLMQYCNYRQ